MPEVCGDYIEAVAEKLIKAGAPLLENAMTKVLTESEVRAEVKKEAARNPKKVEVPTELAEVDKLLVGVLESGDAKIDELLKRVPTVERIKESTVGRVQAKVAGAKTYVHSKVEEVRPAVAYKVEAAKAVVTTAVQRQLEDERVQNVVLKTEPYYNLVKDNVEPAKSVLCDLATAVRAEVSEKGYVGFARGSAEALTKGGVEAMGVCREKGAVEGVKELSSTALRHVVAALEEAKKDNLRAEAKTSACAPGVCQRDGDELTQPAEKVTEDEDGSVFSDASGVKDEDGNLDDEEDE